jgi:preprotein translocase subunit YajC
LAVDLSRGRAHRTNWKDAPVMGELSAAAAAAKSSSGSYTFLLLIAIVIFGFYFLMIRPQRRRQQAVQQQQRTVAPGARVRTTAGMYATVTAVDGDDVILEVAPGVEVRYMKRAIMEVVAPGQDEETVTDAHDAEYAEDDVPEDDDAVDTHAEAEPAAEGSADSHGDVAGSDKNKDNVF